MDQRDQSVSLVRQPQSDVVTESIISRFLHEGGDDVRKPTLAGEWLSAVVREIQAGGEPNQFDISERKNKLDEETEEMTGAVKRLWTDSNIPKGEEFRALQGMNLGAGFAADEIKLKEYGINKIELGLMQKAMAIVARGARVSTGQGVLYEEIPIERTVQLAQEFAAAVIVLRRKILPDKVIVYPYTIDLGMNEPLRTLSNALRSMSATAPLVTSTPPTDRLSKGSKYRNTLQASARMVVNGWATHDWLRDKANEYFNSNPKKSGRAADLNQIIDDGFWTGIKETGGNLEPLIGFPETKGLGILAIPENQAVIQQMLPQIKET